MFAMPSPAYPVATILGLMTSFELGASMLSGNRRQCTYMLDNALSSPNTFLDYMDDSLVKRTDDPLWINDFAVDFQPNYFCQDEGFSYVIALFLYLVCMIVLYQRFRGNRNQDFYIAGHVIIGIAISAVSGFGINQIFTGIVPSIIWLALVCMPLHIDGDWMEKEGYLRFE